MLIQWKASDTHCCGFVRAEMIARELNQLEGYHLNWKTDLHLSDFFGPDIMVFQRSGMSGDIERARYARERNIKVVYEVDDDLFSVPRSVPRACEYYSNPKTLHNMESIVRKCNAITVSTGYLANRWHERFPTKPVYIIENAIDVEYWDFRKPKTPMHPYVSIGFMGSESHREDIQLVIPHLVRLMTEFQDLHIHFIGLINIKTIGPDLVKFLDRIHLRDWVPIEDLPEAMSEFSIGLAPLVDSEFNRSKSAIKALQYGALRIPCVASPVQPYTEKLVNEKNSFLVVGEEWYLRLKQLIVDSTLRERMGNELRSLAEKHSAKAMSQCWASVFDHIAGG